VTGGSAAGQPTRTAATSFKTDAETIASKVDSRRTRRVGTLPPRPSYYVRSNLENVR
jgi:hypothetical protein